MALVVKDRVQETSTTTGTGTLTLGGALTGFQSFSSAIGNGNTTYYAITLNGEWEVGLGTVGSGTLTRDTVLESSNSGSLVNFSAGIKNVFCTYPAEKSLYLNSNNTLSLSNTNGLTNATWTTATRPSSPSTGQQGYNTTTNQIEVYNSTYNNWVNAGTSPIYSSSYLVVAGGGGGGNDRAGGGGAGGLLTGTATLNIGTTYSITVGAGGAALTNGNNSVISGAGLSTITSTGGGYGANITSNGVGGGSGGGAGANAGGTQTFGGAGTSGQGNSGGNGHGALDGPRTSGGGGGASAAGTSGSAGAPNGGAGTSSSITGSSITYAGGGGGGSAAIDRASNGAGAGGSGGGGAGGAATGSVNGTSGTANLGGGGGGAGGSGSGTGGSGGSGVVILSVPTANYSGTTTGSPTITTSGSNTIIKFTSSGSYTA